MLKPAKVCLSDSLSLSLSLPEPLSLSLSVCLPARLAACLPACLSMSLSVCLSISLSGPTQFPIHLQTRKSPADWIHDDSPDLVVHPNGGQDPAGHVAAGRGGTFPQLNGPSRVVTVRMAQDGQRAPIVWGRGAGQCYRVVKCGRGRCGRCGRSWSGEADMGDVVV